MAITFEREQQATIQAYHRNRHDPRIKDLGVDTILDMVRIFRIWNIDFIVIWVEQDTVEVEHPIFSIQSIIWDDVPEYRTSAGSISLEPG